MAKEEPKISDLNIKKVKEEGNSRVYKYQNIWCVINRHPYHNTLNGYIGIPETHPWYHIDYMDLGIRVHGGLTWADLCVPVFTVDEDLWWLGFDCCHLNDLDPYKEPGGRDETYKDMEYVEEQIKGMIHQYYDVIRSELERQLDQLPKVKNK